MYMTGRTLAKEVGLSYASLLAMAKAGQIPYLQIGNRFMFEKLQVLEALQGLSKQNGFEEE